MFILRDIAFIRTYRVAPLPHDLIFSLVCFVTASVKEEVRTLDCMKDVVAGAGDSTDPVLRRAATDAAVLLAVHRTCGHIEGVNAIVMTSVLVRDLLALRCLSVRLPVFLFV